MLSKVMKIKKKISKDLKNKVNHKRNSKLWKKVSPNKINLRVFQTKMDTKYLKMITSPCNYLKNLHLLKIKKKLADQQNQKWEEWATLKKAKTWVIQFLDFTIHKSQKFYIKYNLSYQTRNPQFHLNKRAKR